MAIPPENRCDPDSKAEQAHKKDRQVRSMESPFWATPLGEHTLSAESEFLHQATRRVHGDAVLWVGSAPAAASVMKRGMIRVPLYLNQQKSETDGKLHAEFPSFTAELEELPFQTASLDAVVLHHALETVADPRVALREAVRVLTPGGRLIIAGFNPWSLVGVRRLYARCSARFKPDVLVQRRLVNPIRLFDWLTVLGFELDAPPAYGGPGLFFNRTRFAVAPRPASALPFGGVLVVSAMKKSQHMHFRFTTPERKPRLAPVTYPRVASWERSDHEGPEQ